MVTSAPQQECREITPALLRTSATAQVVRLLAGRPVEQVRLPRVQQRHCDSNGDTDGYSNCYTDGNIYAYRPPHIHTDFNGDSNSYTYFDTETFTDAKMAPTPRPPYAAAAPVDRVAATSSRNAVSFSSAHDKALTVVAMCVCNPDRSPFAIHS